MIKKAAKIFEEIIPLPAWCMSCEAFVPNATSPYLCATCAKKLPRWYEGICLSCGHVHQMGDCEENWALALNSFTSVFGYLDPVKAWVAKFKYGGNLNAGRLLRELLKEYFRLHPSLTQEADLIIPVPSHPSKLTKRGFNVPSFLLDIKGLRINMTAVQKTKSTQTQASLHQKERVSNLYQAFSANTTEVAGKRILVFDDVCTTGRTLEEMAITLKRAGATHVDALVLARVVMG
ncbi:MAG: ComF family protein [SAR324 cluster bacterium]|nr:ComF family protein [SAR324 cluster bacterium]